MNTVRERAPGRTLSDNGSAALLGGGFALIAVAAFVADLGSFTTHTALVWAGLVAAYAVASRTEFKGITGSAVPTEPVLVALLVTGPLGAVPLGVLLGLLLGAERGHWRRGWPARSGILAVSGWHCLGPVAVLHAWGLSDVTLADWPVLLIALALQFAVDAGTASLRCASLDVPLGRLWTSLRWTFCADAVLAPMGLSAALAADGSFAVVVLVAAPVLLVKLLERDRSHHLTTAVAMSRAYEVVEVQARVDALTGLSNRRAWDEAVAQAQARLHEPHRGVVVVLADLDHLKEANDSLGHDAGDALIVAAARALAAAARPGDVVARLGGDEFGLLCECPSANVLATRDRISTAIDAHVRSAEPACGTRLSISYGAHGVRAGGDLAAAIRAADEAAQAYKTARRAARL